MREEREDISNDQKRKTGILGHKTFSRSLGFS